MLCKAVKLGTARRQTDADGAGRVKLSGPASLAACFETFTTARTFSASFHSALCSIDIKEISLDALRSLLRFISPHLVCSARGIGGSSTLGVGAYSPIGTLYPQKCWQSTRQTPSPATVGTAFSLALLAGFLSVFRTEHNVLGWAEISTVYFFLYARAAREMHRITPH